MAMGEGYRRILRFGPIHADRCLLLARRLIVSLLFVLACLTASNPAFAAPVITSIAPNAGPSAGGTTVTITGSGFLGATDVTLNGISAAYTVVNNTTITVTTPASAAGAAFFIVSTPTGTVGSPSAFTYSDPPTITTFTPTAGPLIAGTVVTINGTNLNTVTSVIVGTVTFNSSAITVVSPSQIKVTLPAMTAGSKTVQVLTPGGTATAAATYNVAAPPTITSLSPSAVALNTATSVTITGTNFTGFNSMTFGGAAVTPTSVTATTITFPVPANATAASRAVVVTANGQNSNSVTFNYFGIPTITSSVQPTVTTAGGTAYTLNGTGFYAPMTLTVNGTAVTPTIVNTSKLTFNPPPMPAGAASLVVTTPSGTSATNVTALTYISGAPTITSISPTSGSNATVVTINGTNFADISSVKFGTNIATNVNVVNSTRIDATVTGAGYGTSVDVIVTGANGTATLPGGFTYGPDVTLINPIAGPLAGGNSVSISGTGFLTATSVTFGANPVTSFTINSDTQITAIAPARSAGVVSIKVVSSGLSGTRINGYSYIGAPTITSVSPTSGSTGGGTVVTITGTNNANGGQMKGVKFNGIAATGVTWVNATTITATTPSGFEGLSSVTVDTLGGSFTIPNAFTYLPATPVVTAVTPSRGPVGGRSVVITGQSFSPVSSAVFFGATPAVSFTVDSPTQITAVAPPGVAGTSVSVKVTTLAGASVAFPNAYTYVAVPTVTSASPTNLTTLGGNTVTINGTDLLNASVTFDGAAATIQSNTATQVVVTAPTHAVGAATATIAADGGSVTRAFTYFSPPAITSVTPAAGKTAGGDTITITGTDFTGATSVTIGGAAATVTSNDGTQITATTPAGAAGAANVVVTTSYGPGTAVGAFTYVPPPAITSVAPAAGRTAGGDSITITGTALAGATGVTIGGQAAAITSNTATQIVATTPAGTAGAANVVVTTPYGQTTSTGAFTYVLPPAITSVLPVTGTTLGGNSVTITGTDLAGATGVTVGGTAATITSNTATQLVVSTPAGTAGSANVAVSTPYGSITATGAFNYISPPAITSVAPAAGRTAGGDTVTITGTDLAGATGVTIGGAAATITSNSATQITVTTPAGAAGAASVAVATPYGSTTAPGAFTYVSPPAIASVTPAAGRTAGGDNVTITGTDLAAATGVTVGGSAATITANTGTQITVTTPAGAAGAATVAVSTPYGSAAATGAFTYVSPPTISSVTPAAGKTAGGNSLTIAGTDLAGATTVTIGGSAATITSTTATQITVTTPAGSAGTVDVALSTPYGSVSATAAFTYVSPPAITSVTPAAGRTAGGDSLTITGTDLSGATAVTIGGSAATITTNTGTQVTVTTPAGTAGLVDFALTTPYGSVTATGAYTYVLPPAISSVAPTTGRTAGGDSVTITGTNFSGATGVTIGGTAATITSSTATSLVVTTPPGAAGTADVSVTTPYGSNTSAGAFTYIAPPAITSVVPSTGTTLGGTSVTITGTDFAGATGVTIGGSAATITSSTATSLVVTTPAGTAGTANIAVATPYGSVTASAAFTYVSPPVIASLAPTKGRTAGGDTITITGTDLAGATGLTIGGNAATITSNTATKIVATTPAGTAGTVDVVVITPYGQDIDMQAFTYVAPPAIASVAPATGKTAGGQTVTVTGTDLAGATGMTIGGLAATITSNTDTQIVAATPAGTAGAADVAIATPYGSVTAAGAFTYVLPPAFVSVAPANGTTLGGETVTITGTDLAGATGLTIGGNPATITSNSGTTIVATTPTGTAGAAAIVVTTPYGSLTASAAFTYVPPPAIASVSPTAGTTLGGDAVTITGTHLAGATAVTVGGQAAAITSNTATQLAIVTPAGSAGAADVIVTTPYGSFTATGAFTYVPPPAVASVTPSSGTTLGGETVTIAGTDLANASVSFDGVAAAIQSNTATEVRVTTPAHAAGGVTLVLTTVGGSESRAFTYVSPPAIASVSPASGRTAGGDSVTITGTDLAGATAVTIGGSAATITSNTGTTIIATTPAGAAGAVGVTVTTPYGSATAAGAFTYVAPPAIASLAPTTGTTLGGDSVTITGTDLAGTTGVTIGGSAATITSNTATKLVVTTPAGTAGAADVMVATPYGSVTATGAFTYVSPPAITAVAPSTGTTLGGDSVTITGTDFSGATGVTIGGHVATITANTATEITVTTPSGTAGPAAIAITTPYGSDTAAGAFTYVSPPAIASVAPGAGKTAGGDTVTITGTDLAGATGVTIGGQAASITSNTVTEIVVTTPAHSAGAANVVVSTAYGSTTATGAFTYVAPPAIASVAPATGTTLGGDSVTINGTDLAGATGVTIGGAAATITSNTATKLVVSTPAGAAGTADIAIATPYGSVTAAASFTYVSPPTIISVMPATGTTLGGDSVTITGTDLAGATGVTIGGHSATVTANTATAITVTTPTGTAGAADVVVSTPYGSYTETNAFTYVSPPAIASVAPAAGKTSGGDSVTITGTDFAGATGVTIGGSAAAITSSSATQIVVDTPAGTAGAADVVVTTAYGQDTAAGAFTYVGPPTVVSVAPSSGPFGGGTSVTITGTNFTGTPQVTFGGTPASAVTVLDTTRISAVTPAGAPGPADVEVTTAYGSGTGSGVFTYIDGPVVTNVTPLSGEATGGAVVTIDGTDLGGATVTVDGAPVTPLVNTASQIRIAMPAHAVGPATLLVTTPSGSAAPQTFTYLPPVVIALSPAAGALPDAQAGLAYSQTITASGGSGSYVFAVTAGTLPSGLTLSPAGLLSGTPAATGHASFTVTVLDGLGHSGVAAYTLAVNPSTHVTVDNKTEVVEAGFSPPDVYLNKGATGGPFLAAAIVYVDPPNAGRATITRGELASTEAMAPAGFYLRFTPDPQFSGKAKVGYTLTSALGVSNTGTVTYIISRSQLQALEDKRQLEERYLAGRQSLLADALNTPSLRDRLVPPERADGLNYAFTPSTSGLALGVSLTHRVLSEEDDAAPITIWANSAFMLRQGFGPEGTGKPSDWGNFAIASIGADYLLSDKALIGLAMHVHHGSDPLDGTASASGDGWLAGPYVSVELAPNVVLDASALYGRSSNELDMERSKANFDTSLWMLRGTLRGELEISDGIMLSPRLDASYIRELVGDNVLSNDLGQRVDMGGFVTEQLRGSIGFDLRRDLIVMEGVVVTPSLALDLGYAALDGNGVFVTVKPGVAVVTRTGWSLLGGIQMSFAENGDMVFGVTAEVRRRF